VRNHACQKNKYRVKHTQLKTRKVKIPQPGTSHKKEKDRQLFEQTRFGINNTLKLLGGRKRLIGGSNITNQYLNLLYHFSG